ncbi:protamine P1 [Colletotrichum sublineola]|uniref:Putative protamine P1 n=1 Tax=Colletotrichum sublineola TaxID=1173701 RepID=A0A066XEG6_COLSU|nr:protamine P1 [Colletotrichum sublineola]KDN67317.1 putative protamine P1 [Colletotrichum sublineola]
MDLEEGWRVRCLDDEPIYCEAPHDEAEVLYAGSDDEYYDNPDERKSRYEEAAIRFLQGHTPALLTTVLRGPFEGPDAKGWVNPWQSRRKTAPVVSAKNSAPDHMLEITSDPEPEIIETQNGGSPTSCHLPSPRSLDQVDITPHPFLEEDDLKRVESWRSTAESATRIEETAWSFDASLSQSQRPSQRKRRPVGSEWLKRDDSKRRKASDKVHDLERPFVTSQRNTTSLHRELSDPRTPSQQKQQDSIADAEAGRKSLESPEASSSSPFKASHAVTTRSSQQLLSQVYDKRDSSPEMPAPLSTPIQTPQSSRKSGMTPRKATVESGPRNSGAAMTEQISRGRDEFETQQDESFLFRARPRERARGIMPLNPIPGMSFGRASSLASTASSETDSHAELLDLDGDTCMADETKATSPESSVEGKEHHRESLKKITGMVVEQMTETEAENNGLQPEHSSGKLATSHTEDTLVAVNHTPIGGLKQLELSQPSPPIQQGAVPEVMTEGSAQASTVVAHSTSEEGQDNEPTEDVGRTPLLSTRASQLPIPTQSAPQPSISQESAMSRTFPQSPSSKLSQFATASPITKSDESRQRLGNVEASISGGTPTYNALTTPLTAEVKGEPVSGSTVLNSQSEARPLRICGSSRIEKIIGEGDSPAIPASQQSPWKADVPAMASLQQQQFPTEDGHKNFVDPSCQSPWTASPEIIRPVAQAALLSNVSAVATPVSPSPLAPPALMNSDVLVVNRASDSQQAAAVDTGSSSPPEPIFCIKSFAKFMSPSPERPRRRSNKIRLSDGHLPSTQNLIAATTDNPWGSARSSKRVRWAPLPHENDSGEDRCPQTPTGPRASSPPPETAVADLPTGDDDQYQKHFQAVSRRRKLHRHLLPSASQQFLESPAPMAMAEAFVAADSFRAPPASETTTCPGETPLPMNAETQESALDDVDDVLCNLREFIEMVDVEADLARAKEGEQNPIEKRQQQQQRSQTLGGAFANGLNFDGVMDAGVWD